MPWGQSSFFFPLFAAKSYSSPAKFNHTQRSWLVIWEAGVIVELPPWVIAAYPSSLFVHFNIDISGSYASVFTKMFIMLIRFRRH